MATEYTPVPDRIRLAPISWPAIFASLVVGISVVLLMTLAGVAIGVTVVQSNADGPQAITIGAATWQALSMLVAAIVGSYVAARLSGLRRTGDGVLHGAVAWGATTVLYAMLATTALGALTAGMFGLLTPSATEHTAQAISTLSGERDDAQRTLERLGLTPEQARTVVSQLALPGPAAGQGIPTVDAARIDETVSMAGSATGWLTATLLLSLLLSLAGGAIGTRATRRINRRIEKRETGAMTISDAPAGILTQQS